MHALPDRRLAAALRAALTALVLVGLLALVAIAARGGHPDAHGRLHQREVPARVSNDLLTVVIVVYALGVLGLIIGLWSLRDRWQKPEGRRWWVQLIIIGAVMALLTLLGYRSIANGNLRRALERHQSAAQKAQEPHPKRPRTLPQKGPVARRPAQFDWVLAGAIGGGLLLAFVVMVARRRAAEDEEVAEPAEPMQDELTSAVSESIDDLRNEPDYRRAVIAAYARMERVLGRHGQPRRPAEAPLEYLARVLTALRVRAAAVSDLTELFERAKFSTHAIDATMKERAIRALVAVRDDLEAASA